MQLTDQQVANIRRLRTLALQRRQPLGPLAQSLATRYECSVRHIYAIWKRSRRQRTEGHKNAARFTSIGTAINTQWFREAKAFSDGRKRFGIQLRISSNDAVAAIARIDKARRSALSAVRQGAMSEEEAADILPDDSLPYKQESDGSYVFTFRTESLKPGVAAVPPPVTDETGRALAPQDVTEQSRVAVKYAIRPRHFDFSSKFDLKPHEEALDGVGVRLHLRAITVLGAS